MTDLPPNTRPAPPPDPFDVRKLPYCTRARSNPCSTCGKPPTQMGPPESPTWAFLFRDRLSAEEYRISGCCQGCQDDVFNEDEEAE